MPGWRAFSRTGNRQVKRSFDYQRLGLSALTFRQPSAVTFSQGSLGSFKPSCMWTSRWRAVTPLFGTKEKTMSKFLKLIKNNKGATAIEYGLIAALIAVAAIGAMQGIGNKLNTTFNNVSNHLN